MIITVYVTALFGYLFIYHPFIVSKRIGKSSKVWDSNPSQNNKTDKLLFSITTYGLLLILWLQALNPALLHVFTFYENIVSEVGFTLLLAGSFICLKSQYDMSNSWRMGVDKNEKTNLVSTGFFKYSRNPFYVGLILIFTGVSLITVNVLCIAVTVIEIILIHRQILKEEKVLLLNQGKEYSEYCSKVGRYF